MRGFFGRRAVRVVGVVALVVVVVAFLFMLLNWYVAPAEPGARVRKDLVLAVAQILGGTALLSGLYFTWRTLQVNREGQITDRFTRAIDQLGKVEDSQKLFEIRVGGIYALERIARESEEDHWPIMEILTAYVRQNAPLPPEASQERTEDATDERRAKEGSRGKSETTEPSAPDPDIQAIMTILRRRSRSYGKGEPETLDLTETNLSGARLFRANLLGANLSGSDLSGAIFAETNLSKAWLSKANFSEANLSRANLSGSDLKEADLSGADLRGANLSGANFSGANLSGANLSGANLSRANLGAVLFESGELLSGADLSGAFLLRADLSRANLAGFGEYASGANLSGAILNEAILNEANLSGANLRGANLSVAQHLTQEQLEQAEGNENTKLPSDLKPSSTWDVKTDEQGEGD